jgi:ATPase family associated with various cellular activities (AAA)
MNVRVSPAVINAVAAELNEGTFSERVRAICKYASTKELVNFDLAALSPRQLETFNAHIEKLPSDDKSKENALRTLRSWEAVHKDPTGAKCGSLKQLTTFLRTRIEQCPHRWLFSSTPDGFMVPYYVESITYEEANFRTGRDQACVNVGISAYNRFIRCRDTLIFYQRDLTGRKTIDELLREKRYFCETAELVVTYDAQVEIFKTIKDQTGEQFLAKGQGMTLGNSYRPALIYMDREGEPTRCVIDDIFVEERETHDISPTVSSAYWTGQEDETPVILPVLPYVKVFDLTEHEFVVVHVNNLTPYPYREDLVDKLILDTEKKEVVEILTADVGAQYEDIIKGKSGGVIVMCTGDPGLGKTLTAEVYAEIIKRPLYIIQCSQLGTNPESLEKNLRIVLARAVRFKAVLLIDEADVYVRARGDDIQQNAIVGVFLRVLEYYRGLLFLTSNRATIIDDAIVSRVTAHITYEYPTRAELTRIWTILSECNRITLDESEKAALVEMFPQATGRNIKMLLKLFQRLHSKKPDKDKLALFQIAGRYVDIATTNKSAPQT